MLRPIGSPITRRSIGSFSVRTLVYIIKALWYSLIGSVSRPGDRNGELIWQFCISLVLTCAIFVFTPALGHVAHIGTGWMKTLTMIRNGEWAALDFSHIEGIVSFPSFHTTLAILLVYAVRHHRWALAVLFPLNMLLIVATLSVGGHYLVDLPAGAAVAAISIAATRLLRQHLAKCRLGHFPTWRTLRRASERDLQRLQRHSSRGVALATTRVPQTCRRPGKPEYRLTDVAKLQRQGRVAPDLTKEAPSNRGSVSSVGRHDFRSCAGLAASGRGVNPECWRVRCTPCWSLCRPSARR